MPRYNSSTHNLDQFSIQIVLLSVCEGRCLHIYMGQPSRRGLRGFEAVVDDPPNLGSKKSLDKISQPTHCGH